MSVGFLNTRTIVTMSVVSSHDLELRLRQIHLEYEARRRQINQVFDQIKLNLKAVSDRLAEVAIKIAAGAATPTPANPTAQVAANATTTSLEPRVIQHQQTVSPKSVVQFSGLPTPAAPSTTIVADLQTPGGIPLANSHRQNGTVATQFDHQQYPVATAETQFASPNANSNAAARGQHPLANPIANPNAGAVTVPFQNTAEQIGATVFGGVSPAPIQTTVPPLSQGPAVPPGLPPPQLVRPPILPLPPPDPPTANRVVWAPAGIDTISKIQFGWFLPGSRLQWATIWEIRVPTFSSNNTKSIFAPGGILGVEGLWAESTFLPTDCCWALKRLIFIFDPGRHSTFATVRNGGLISLHLLDPNRSNLFYCGIMDPGANQATPFDPGGRGARPLLVYYHLLI